MKKVFFYALVGGICLFASCGSGSGNKDSVDSANAMNDQKDTSGMMNSHDTSMAAMPVDKDVADFAVKAADISFTEIALGKLAQDKASSQRVKDFGAMMVQDHTQANDQLKQIAASKNITLPSEMGDDGKKHFDDLSKKSGTDFDKAYMKMMLDGHDNAKKDFEKAGNDLKDADVKNFALQALPVIQKHIDSAKAILGKK